MHFSPVALLALPLLAIAGPVEKRQEYRQGVGWASYRPNFYHGKPVSIPTALLPHAFDPSGPAFPSLPPSLNAMKPTITHPPMQGDKGNCSQKDYDTCTATIKNSKVTVCPIPSHPIASHHSHPPRYYAMIVTYSAILIL